MQKKFFGRYLEEVNHQKAKQMSNPNLTINLLDMPWKTKNNKTDCGIFAMRHMETFKGQTDGKYSCGFPKEGGSQDVMLDRVRSKYAHRLIMSDINIMKNDILNLARDYSKVPKSKRNQDLQDASQIIQQRLQNLN